MPCQVCGAEIRAAGMQLHVSSKHKDVGARDRSLAVEAAKYGAMRKCGGPD
jgi:hypothetical protein